MNFDHTINEFRRYLWQNGYSKNTIESYTESIEKTIIDKDLEALSQKDLDDIAIELREKYEPGGNRMRHAAINLFCKTILKRQDLHLKIPRSKTKNKDILTNEQMEKILNASKTKGRTVYAMLQILYDCALRKSEICHLNIEDVNFDMLEIFLKNTKTGDAIVTITSRVASAIQDYLLYDRRPRTPGEKALIVNKYGKRIGEHFVRNHLKECAIEAGITKNVYPHMIRASCITHLLNKGINPLTVQQHARHSDFRTTMIYNRPTQQQMKADIERVFVVKSDLTDEDRARTLFDKYLRGELSLNEMNALLEVTQPKQLKPKIGFTGYA